MSDQWKDKCCCQLHLDPKNEPGAYAHFRFLNKDREIQEKLEKFPFNIIIDASGKQTVLGNLFTHKKSVPKLEIVISANFVNTNSKAARFASLLSQVRFDIENFVLNFLKMCF